MSAAAASPPWELLARHLAGEATPTDEAAVRAWQAAAPDNAVLWQQLTGVWTETAAAPAAASAFAFGAADTAHAWQKFEATVLGPPTAGPPAPTAPVGPPPVAPPLPGAGALVGWGKTAALLVVGAGAGWLLRTAVPPAAEAPAPSAQRSVVAAAPSAAPPAAPLAPAPAVDLVFEDAPVADVARRLEGAFPGTRVVLADSALAGQRFTGTFRAARPAAVLRVVSVATGATLARQPDSAWVLTRATR